MLSESNSVSLSTRKPARNRIALAAVCLTSLMFGLEISSVPVILPTLQKTLQGSFRDMEWIMNAYTIACTTVLMATGTLADRYGRRKIYTISILFFGLTSLLCGLATSAPLLIIGRTLQGIAGGAMLICQVAILSHQFQEGKERSRAFGAWGIIFGTGLGFGPIIGGMIVSVSNWQWVFLVHVVLAIVSLVLVYSGVQESRDPQAKRIDIGGILTLTLTVLGFTWIITQGPSMGFGSPLAIGIIIGIVLSFLAFIRVEKVNKHPMFDFSVFRIRKFSGALLGSMGMNFSFWPFMIYLPIYFQVGLGYDSVMAGMSLLAYTLPTLLFPPLGEWLTVRFRPGRVIPLGLFTIGLGFLAMKAGSSLEHASWLTMLPGALLAGAGLGIVNTPVTNTTTGAVSANRAGMASGIDMSARLISLAVNIALMGFILVEGTLGYLQSRLPGGGHPLPLRALAEKVAAGTPVSSDSEFPGLAKLDPSGTIVHDALVHGFGQVLLYGGISVCLLALFSLLIFGVRGKEQ